MVLYDFQKLILYVPLRHPLGYVHTDSLNIPTIEVTSYQDMIFFGHHPSLRFIEFQMISQLASSSGDSVQSSSRLKSNENTITLTVTYSVFTDSIKGF